MAPPPFKLGPSRKISIVKIAQPKAKPGPQGTSKIELALVKPIGVSKKFCLLDVAALSYRLHVGGLAVNDSSLDVHETPSPKNTGEKCASPPPSSSGEFLCFAFALLPHALMTFLQVLPGFHLHWICHWKVWMKTWNPTRNV
jgi:hypothetical protein